MKKIGAFVACTLIIGTTIAFAGAVTGARIARADGADDQAFQSRAQGESSPFVVAPYKFAQTTTGANTTTIVDSEFRVINPTKLNVTLEYSFFDEKGDFCGCDVDQMRPNATTVYTMNQELAAGFFTNSTPSTQYCDLTDTSGAIKSIVFTGTHDDKVKIDGATLVGWVTHVFDDVVEPEDSPSSLLTGKRMMEAGQKGVEIDDTTLHEIQHLHKKCVKFQSELPPSTM